MRKSRMVCTLGLCIAGFAVAAQVSSFEVASVKPVNPPAGPHVVSLIVNHGKLNIEAAELRQIVGLAYAVQRVRVLGGPGWADSDQFDIVANAESADATRDEIRSMLQTLLAERFKLCPAPCPPFHHELCARAGHLHYPHKCIHSLHRNRSR